MDGARHLSRRGAAAPSLQQRVFLLRAQE
jgi:hypothetical protein